MSLSISSFWLPWRRWSEKEISLRWHSEAISKMSITNCCGHYKAISKMRIANLCCHCKNFIQNAYCKFMMSLQEFYPKYIFQRYAVIARILCQTRIANLCCQCKNFIYTIHCNHSLGFFFKIMQQALNNEPSAVPQWYFQLSCTIS